MIKKNPINLRIVALKHEAGKKKKEMDIDSRRIWPAKLNGLSCFTFKLTNLLQITSYRFILNYKPDDQQLSVLFDKG